MQANKYKVGGRVKSLQTNVHKCMILKSKDEGSELKSDDTEGGGESVGEKGDKPEVDYFLIKTYIANIATILTRLSQSTS